MCHTFIKIKNIYFEKKRQKQFYSNINREIIKLNQNKKKQLTFELIYTFSQKELNSLKTYLNENLTKELIKKFESLTKYSILFELKKNETFRLCVDY